MFQDVNTSEDNPVSKPFLNFFLIMTLGIKSDKRVENRVGDTDCAGNVRLTETKNAAGCSKVQSVSCEFCGVLHAILLDRVYVHLLT